MNTDIKILNKTLANGIQKCAKQKPALPGVAQWGGCRLTDGKVAGVFPFPVRARAWVSGQPSPLQACARQLTDISRTH